MLHLFWLFFYLLFFKLLTVLLLLKFIRLCDEVDLSNILRDSNRKLTLELSHHLLISFLTDFLSCHASKFLFRILLDSVSVVSLHNRCETCRFFLLHQIRLDRESILLFKRTHTLNCCWGVSHRAQLDL